MNRICCFVCLLAVAGLGYPLRAAADEDITPDALDAELLDSLNNELLEGLDTLPKETDEAAPAAGGAAADAEEDDFERISRQMRTAKRLMAEAEAAPATKAQQQIVRDMEKLIAELEQQCQKCKSGASSGSKSSQTSKREKVDQPSSEPQSDSGEHDASKPAQDSTSKLGEDQVRKADMDQMHGLLKDIWGQLPDKARDQMLQAAPERFLPKYELLIEDYYKRLSERQSK